MHEMDEMEKMVSDPDVDYIVGVDLDEPEVDLDRTEFVRADIRNPLIVKVLQACQGCLPRQRVRARPARAPVPARGLPPRVPVLARRLPVRQRETDCSDCTQTGAPSRPTGPKP